MANKKPLRLGHGPTQVSAVAPKQVERLRTNGVYYIHDNLVTVGAFVPNTWCYIDIPIGRYTYRQWGFSLRVGAAIAGVTRELSGQHLVETDHIPDYVDTFIIEIDGKAVWELTADEFIRWSAYQNHDTAPCVLRFAFGAPNLHNTDAAEDAYQLGTGNLRSLKLRVKTKAAWPNGMQPILNVEYAPVSRPIGYFQTTTRYTHTNPGAGKFAITDIAVGLDFAAIWVQGNDIDRVKLTVDREEVIDCSKHNLLSMHDCWGKDMYSLGTGVLFDNFRDGDSIGLDSVSDSVAERRRGADVRLELDMSSAGQKLVVVVFHCGLFKDQ